MCPFGNEAYAGAFVESTRSGGADAQPARVNVTKMPVSKTLVLRLMPKPPASQVNFCQVQADWHLRQRTRMPSVTLLNVPGLTG